MTFRDTLRLPWLLLLFALAAGGCSQEKTMPPELAGVYHRIVEAREDFEAGFELIVAGDDVAGENLLAAASTRLVVAGRECARTPGCDAGLIAASTEEIAAKLKTALRLAAASSSADVDDDEPLVEGEEPGPSMQVDSVSLLRGSSLEEVIPLNPRVLAQLNVWLTWKRPDLIDAYRNYGFLRQQVAPVFHEAGLPEALLFGIIATESGGKVHAYSRAGAVGPLQFMPATARRYGLHAIDGFDTRLDPVRATRASARYLEDRLRHFHGNLELALAAYNAGETRVGRYHRRLNGVSFWEPQLYYALPRETRTYVPRVLAAAWLFMHPDDHGVTFPEAQSTLTTVKLGAAASLGEIAICLGNAPGEPGWFRTLRNLNPQISPKQRIPAGSPIDVPTEVVDTFATIWAGESVLAQAARTLHDAEYPENPEVITYTVRRGDTLAAIADRHRSSVSELSRLNEIRPPDYVIQPGQQLIVPPGR